MVIMPRIRCVRFVAEASLAAVFLLAAVLVPRASAFLPSHGPGPASSRHRAAVRSSPGSTRSSSAVEEMQLERHNVEEKVTEQVAIGRAAFLSTGAAAVAAAVMAGTGAMVAAPRIAAADIGGLPIPFVGGRTSRPEQGQVLEVAQYSLVVNKVEEDLRAGALKGGAEDSAVVVRILETFLKPMQQTMAKAAPAMRLAGRENVERVKLLPLLMKGHLLELEEACEAGSAKDQLREVEEVKETVDEFLALAKSRYEVTAKAPTSPEGDQLGIFGCTFYGLKRVEGTNTCQNDP